MCITSTISNLILLCAAIHIYNSISGDRRQESRPSERYQMRAYNEGITLKHLNKVGKQYVRNKFALP